MLNQTIMNHIIDIVNGNVSITDNPMFDAVWNDYANKYNALAKQLKAVGIDMNLLIDVVEAAKKVAQLGYTTAYLLGYTDCAINNNYYKKD
ncbi:hypothetical protein [Caldanaerobius polysaccharolyticus]|uniref:hypothetical protein n=1 Tax=Caldanaerobius polysaccharolyticus TaxID=44256 RepID=UPI0004798A78|nr:hypothetical protein [Caldanaerobius polysaccharolyticus]